MRGVAEQRDAAVRPARQGILVDHRVFENLVGCSAHRRHVEPVEPPTLDRADEIVELALPVPVALLDRRVLLNVADPVDELAALGVDVVTDRIDQNLGGLCQPMAPSGGRAPARTPRHVDRSPRRASSEEPLRIRNAFIAAITTEPRCDSVCHRRISSWRRVNHRAGAGAAVIDRRSGASALDTADHLQIAAVDREHRPVVAAVAPTGRCRSVGRSGCNRDLCGGDRAGDASAGQFGQLLLA